MIKQIGLFIVLSILATIFLHELHYLFSLITLAYHALYRLTGLIFSSDWLGTIVRQSVVFILAPLLIAFIINLIHKLIKKSWLPQHSFVLTLWITWIIMITLLAR